MHPKPIFFVGEGPYTLEDGSNNILARGFLLSVASFGLVKYTDGSLETYALQATGTISAVGIEELDIAGEVTLRYNSFTEAISESVSTGDSNAPISMSADETASLSGDAFFEIDGHGLALEVAGQIIAANINLSRYRSGDRKVFRASLNKGNASFSASETKLLTLGELSGDIFLFEDGIAAQASGNLAFGVASVSAGGSYSLQINTTGNSITENFIVGNASREVTVAAGPYLRITGIGAELIVLNQTVSGNFLFEQNATGDVIATASEVNTSFGDGALVLSDAEGVISINSTGLAASISGGVELTIPEVAISADLDLNINTRNLPVNETVKLNGVEKALQIRAGPTFALEATQVLVEIVDQILTTDLFIEETNNDLTKLSFSNTSLSLRSENRNLVSVTDANGHFELSKAGSYRAVRHHKAGAQSPWTLSLRWVRKN